MDESQLKQLISESLTALKDEILTEVRRADQGVASNLTKELKKIQDSITSTQPESQDQTEQPETNQGRLTIKSLQTQLETLQKQIQDKEKSEFESAKKAAISSLVAGKGLNHPGVVQKLFSVEYGDKLQREGDRWYLEGESGTVEIGSLFDQFLNTDEGKYFLPASPVKGAGTTENVKPVSTVKTDDSKSFGAIFAQQLAENI